jgi:nitroreductase
MNETMKTILSRRSIRKFKPEQISDEDLNVILQAGQYAPNAMNEQLWHFVAVQNKDLLNKLTDAFKNVYLKSGNPKFEAVAKSENFNPYYNAPTFIMVFCDEKAIAPTHDGSLAIGNMLLAAEAQGLGGCWLHAVNFVFNSVEGKDIVKEYGVPEGYAPVGALAVGYKAVESPEPSPRKEGTITILK